MIIETERLILRSFEEKDANDLFEYLAKPSVNCFLSMKINNLNEAIQAVKERMSDSDFYLAIEEKASNKVIGEIFSYPEATDPEDNVKDTYSPCWMLNEKYQRKGYMYEAAFSYFNYLFENKGARRIYLYTEDYNISCQKLSEKLGMRKEGVFKEFVSFINNEKGEPIYENTLQYAILKSEWLSKLT